MKRQTQKELKQCTGSHTGPEDRTKSRLLSESHSILSLNRGLPLDSAERPHPWDVQDCCAEQTAEHGLRQGPQASEPQPRPTVSSVVPSFSASSPSLSLSILPSSLFTLPPPPPPSPLSLSLQLIIFIVFMIIVFFSNVPSVWSISFLLISVAFHK